MMRQNTTAGGYRMAQGLGFVVMVHNYAFISYREILTCKKSCQDLAIGWWAPTPAILAV